MVMVTMVMVMYLCRRIQCAGDDGDGGDGDDGEPICMIVTT